MIALVVVWLAVIIGTIIMKKIQPEVWIPYTIWAVFIAVLFTVFLFQYKSTV